MIIMRQCLNPSLVRRTVCPPCRRNDSTDMLRSIQCRQKRVIATVDDVIVRYQLLDERLLSPQGTNDLLPCEDAVFDVVVLCHVYDIMLSQCDLFV